MANESNTVKEKQPSNFNSVNWPTDRMGITSILKKEVARTGGRINGKRDKLELVLKTMDIAREHVIERYKAQVAINNQVSKASVDRSAEEARRAEHERQKALARAEQEVDRLKAAGPQEDAAEGSE